MQNNKNKTVYKLKLNKLYAVFKSKEVVSSLEEAVKHQNS